MEQTLILQNRRTLSSIFNLRDWRLFYKLLAATLAIVLPVLIIAGVASTTLSRSAMIEQASTTLIRTSRNTSAAIDQYLVAHREDIVMLSKLPEIMAYAANPNDNVAKANALKSMVAAASKMDYDSVSIVDRRGVTILSSHEPDIGENVASRQYFRPAMEGQVYLSDPTVSFITEESYLYLSAPLRDATGNISGILRNRITINGIWALVERDKDVAGAGTVGILLDENGIRIGHSATAGNRSSMLLNVLFRSVAPLSPAAAQRIASEFRTGTTSEQPVRVLPLPEVANALSRTDVQTFETSADNSSERHYASISSLTTKPWRYVLMAPFPTFTDAADRLGSYFVVITLAATAFALIATYFMARTLARPIVQLTEIADRISLGELDAQIDIQRKDEIGELADAVSRMQASLQAAIERLRARRPT